MKKRVLSCILFLAILLSVIPKTALAARDPSEVRRIQSNEKMKADREVRLLSDVEISSTDNYIRNTYIEAYINENGQFTMGTVEGDPESSTDNNKLLLYGHPDPWSSETLIRIDGNDHIFADHVTSVVFSDDDSECVATAMIDSVEVKQILTLMKNPYTNIEDLVRIRYTYANKSDVQKQVGVRIMLDTMLGSNDGAPFRVNQADVTNEIEYTGNQVPHYWQSFDSLETPNVTSTGFFYFSEEEKPDKVQFADWTYIHGKPWNYTVNNAEALTNDSAVAAYFNPRAIAAYGEYSVVTYYGISAFSSGHSHIGDNLAVRITAPTVLYGSDSGAGYDPFDVIAYLQNIGPEQLPDVKAVISLDSGSGLVIDETQATTVSVDIKEVGSSAAVKWTLRALPQSEETTANYRIRFYNGYELLKEMPLSVLLSELEEAARTCTVTFDLKGGVGTVPPQEVRVGEFVVEPDRPLRSGYSFDGWYSSDEISGSVRWFNSYNNFHGLPITHDITLYAAWNPSSHTLTYSKDTYNFINSRDDFFKEGREQNYRITGDYYEVLLECLEGNDERTAIVSNWMDDIWGGSCFGMSCVLSLVRAGGYLDEDYFQGGASCLFEFDRPADNPTIFNLINYYHLMQYTTRTNEAIWDRASNENESREALVKALQTSSYPVVVCFTIRANGRQIGGHAVVAYDYRETDNRFEIAIWDPNDKETPNTLYISKDFEDSSFDHTYDDNTWSSNMVYPLTVEDENYDYHNIEKRLREMGYTSGSHATSLMSADSEKLTLNTNYYSFKITDLDSQKSATIINGDKTEGDLEISNAKCINEIGQEPNLLFVIKDAGKYQIVPTDDGVTGRYSTTMRNSHATDGFYSKVLANGKGTLVFDKDGTLTTSYEEGTAQKITVSANDATTSWYMVAVESTNTGMTVSPAADHTDISCAAPADVKVTARDDHNSVVFDECALVNDTPVRLTEKDGRIAVLGEQEKNMGYSLIFFSLGGTPIEAQHNIPDGENAVYPEDPVRDGYKFSGWYKVPACTDGEEWSFDTPIIQDTKIYAKWLIDPEYTHTVTFRAPGHDDVIIIVYDGGSLTEDQIPVPPEKTGYDASWDITNFQEIHADIIVNAIYTPHEHVTKFDMQGHGTQIADASTRYGEAMTKPVDPTENEWTFIGWYKEAECINPWCFESDVIAGDMTLYAKWLKSGDINFDGNVNIIDARLALQASSGNRTLTDDQEAVADLNGNGMNDIIDARWLLQISSSNRPL